MRDAMGREWERVEDDEDEYSSTTTVLPSAMREDEPSEYPRPLGVSSERWSPSMNGSLQGRNLWKGTPVPTRSLFVEEADRTANWEAASAPGALEHDSWSQRSWEWNGMDHLRMVGTFMA